MAFYEDVDGICLVARFIKYVDDRAIIQLQNGYLVVTSISLESSHLQKGDAVEINKDTFQILGKVGDFSSHNFMPKKCGLTILIMNNISKLTSIKN